ncbi:hypothetical protein A2943_00040 [Candidatus Adlerbacteria bacterium RIFCSPLOWO2_01_FULL_51_16]|uniref:Hemolytic protein HlpA-like protein n=1 Tax=Candidatus Adlerbacteria bacterium RIFCSPLOWO2_01_FULL_51_16 TaxID=1797243 RepID=A0A1F4XF20_9BACT|nr:MAG: hypothetical protein A2943_00040 [Candidatus Adlerbacteria bacterium RIFCSPLOWO2_01_FULL_51_16]
MIKQLTTPVAIIVFKRLDATKKMFEAVRAAQPQEFYIIADGWRNDAEKEKCLAVRKYLEGAVDWPCAVRKNYADVNLGCKKRVVSGLDWVFSEVEEAIILEDDCVPDQSFFPFCEEILLKYRNEPRVMQIAGLNVQHKNRYFNTNGASYYFSQFGEIWGWATWRRAWSLYDAKMGAWPHAKEAGLLQERIKDLGIVDYFEYRFDFVYGAREDRKKSDVWGAQWIFTQLLHGGLSIVPKTNLISNVGDSDDATHKKAATAGSEFLRMKTTPVVFPLVHPQTIEADELADAFSLRVGSGIKKRPIEKGLFFLKHHAPFLHRALKYLKQ